MTSTILARFGRLVVINDAAPRGYCICQCDCGWIGEKLKRNILSGATKSCGCLHKEIIGKTKRTHGASETLTWRRWRSMKSRCLMRNTKSYPNYGGRGITICQRWINSFENFIQDMGECPAPSMTLDRINCNGNYELSNCRWATRIQQNRNSSHNHTLTHDDKTMCISEWAELTGINYRTIMSRLRKGATAHDALRPIRKNIKTCKAVNRQLTKTYKQQLEQSNVRR